MWRYADAAASPPCHKELLQGPLPQQADIHRGQDGKILLRPQLCSYLPQELHICNARRLRYPATLAQKGSQRRFLESFVKESCLPCSPCMLLAGTYSNSTPDCPTKMKRVSFGCLVAPGLLLSGMLMSCEPGCLRGLLSVIIPS